MKVIVKLSSPGKLPCKSWSLPARQTCTGSRDKHGNIKLSCASCYAVKGNYTWKATKALREFNRRNWRDTDWVMQISDMLQDSDVFRWFDSGDIYHPKLAEKIYEVMKTTATQHWLPTQSYSNPKVLPWLQKMQKLPNVMVRYSSGQINGGFLKQHGSTIVQLKQIREGNISEEKIHVCKVYKDPQTGYDVRKCDEGGKCRACWSKEVPVVAYVMH